MMLDIKGVILPERIREGRRARGFTQLELADAISVSKQAISQYENGSNSPKPEVFEMICDVLKLPPNYFSKPIPYKITTPIFFRKRTTAAKKYSDIFEVKIGWMVEIYQYLKNFIEFPQVKLKTYMQENYSFEEIVQVAEEIREYWGLGKGPISNISLLLENNGFIISKVKAGAVKVDACSFLNTQEEEKRPMIFATPDTSSVRSRRDFVHELGHQVLHPWADQAYFDANRKRLDDEAEWFASAFLLPAESMRREAYAVKSLDSLILLKKRWKVSAQAILYHMRNLEVLSENQFIHLRNKMYKNGWRQSEPLDKDIEQEEPIMISQATKLLLENKIRSPLQFGEEISLPIDDIEDLCGLDRGSLTISQQRAVLKLVK
jgi:Zn-dependent peptidase ImmA (M78 family)/DNA-binding XRE family transcriptional regulator